MTQEATETKTEELGAQETEQSTQETTEQETKETSSSKEEQSSEESTGGEEQEQQDINDAKEAGVDVEEFEKTRKALHKANKEAQKRREQLQQWNELGMTPEEAAELKEEKRQAEIKKAEEEGRYQDLLDQMKQETQQEKEKIQKEVEQRDEMIDTLTRKNEIHSAVSREGGIAEMLEGLLEKETKTIYEEGKPKAVLLDEAGNPRVDDKGNYMSVRQRVRELKDDKVWSHAFPAPKTSGSGTSSQSASKATGNATQANQKPKSQMSLDEKVAFQREHGLEAYQNLPYK